MPVTIRTLRQMKAESRRITMLTCYDATFARLLDEAEVDCLLVGDSLGMVIKGEPNTLNVTVDEVAYHVAAVARGAKRAHIVADMPFMSYQTSPEAALENAAKLMRAGGHSVKLEGGTTMAPVVRRLVEAGIPVMGHVGLLPQSVHAQGGFVVQGRDEEARARIVADAIALEEAGAYAVVLEGIPGDVAVEITSRLSIPTIGIGAGVGCDGQVLVLYDVLGLDPSFKPKFVKRFTEGAAVVTQAAEGYVAEVREGRFPGLEHTFGAKAAGRPANAGPSEPSGRDAKTTKARDLSSVGGYGPAEEDSKAAS